MKVQVRFRRSDTQSSLRLTVRRDQEPLLSLSWLNELVSLVLTLVRGKLLSSFNVRLLTSLNVQKVLNIVICISVLSIGLSCVYGGSRVLTALAETGYAPKCFTYVDKSGRPLYSVMVVLAFGPIA